MKPVPLPLGVLGTIILVAGVALVALGFFQPWVSCTDGTVSASGGACPTEGSGYAAMFAGFLVTLGGFVTMFFALRGSSAR